MGHYTEAEVLRWRGVASEQAASGKSVAAFCRERGLREWQLYEWKKRLRDSEAKPFIAVEISSSEARVQPEPHTTQSSGIELRHRRGWSLMVDPGFDAGHLRRVLSVLETES